MQKVAEEHEADERKIVQEAVRKIEHREQRKEDLKNLFLNSAQLNEMLASEPVEASAQALAKWRSLGPLTVEFILNKSNIDSLNFEATDLEFKKVYFSYGYVIGFFKKGTGISNGICRFVHYKEGIYEGMSKNNGIYAKYSREIYPNGSVKETK